MELRRPSDLFLLSAGDPVTKRNLFDLIQYSKVRGSSYWEGTEFQIGNTPQQGINWVGPPPACHAVIIKTRLGSYEDDGWVGREKDAYHYSFKARGGVVSYKEKANEVLVAQPQHLYPVLLFMENHSSWRFEGSFAVVEIEDKYVVLNRSVDAVSEQAVSQDESIYQEGGRKYVAHLLAERNKDIIKVLKESRPWKCDICSVVFLEKYGVKYIEAHHKVPLSTYSSAHKVTPEEFSLLCPNCHKAVHIYMKAEGLDYYRIKDKLRSQWSKCD